MEEQSGRTVVSVLRIPVRAGAEEAFVESFHRLGVFRHAATLAGFRGGRLLRPVRSGDPFVVTAEWLDPSWYQAWLDHPVRAELTGAISDLVDGEMIGGVYADATEEGPA